MEILFEGRPIKLKPCAFCACTTLSMRLVHCEDGLRTGAINCHGCGAHLQGLRSMAGVSDWNVMVGVARIWNQRRSEEWQNPDD